MGEDDQKLAEGISLYSIASEGHAKPAVLGELIKVNVVYCHFLCLTISTLNTNFYYKML